MHAASDYRSNRTFMELKYENARYAMEMSGCSNRTFMELKWCNHICNPVASAVLIVPLWN